MNGAKNVPKPTRWRFFAQNFLHEVFFLLISLDAQKSERMSPKKGFCVEKLLQLCFVKNILHFQQQEKEVFFPPDLLKNPFLSNSVEEYKIDFDCIVTNLASNKFYQF